MAAPTAAAFFAAIVRFECILCVAHKVIIAVLAEARVFIRPLGGGFNSPHSNWCLRTSRPLGCRSTVPSRDVVQWLGHGTLTPGIKVRVLASLLAPPQLRFLWCSNQVMMGESTCCCIRGEVCCERMSSLLKELHAAYCVGVTRGNWRDFDRLRREFETHFTVVHVARDAPDGSAPALQAG